MRLVVLGVRPSPGAAASKLSAGRVLPNPSPPHTHTRPDRARSRNSHRYFTPVTTGCVHAISRSPATLPFTFNLEDTTRART